MWRSAFGFVYVCVPRWWPLVLQPTHCRDPCSPQDCTSRNIKIWLIVSSVGFFKYTIAKFRCTLFYILGLEEMVHPNSVCSQVQPDSFLHNVSLPNFLSRSLADDLLFSDSYLHSCDPPIIHGNLTCDTIFIQHNGLIKIGSGLPPAGVFMLLQPSLWLKYLNSA